MKIIKRNKFSSRGGGLKKKPLLAASHTHLPEKSYYFIFVFYNQIDEKSNPKKKLGLKRQLTLFNRSHISLYFTLILHVYGLTLTLIIYFNIIDFQSDCRIHFQEYWSLSNCLDINAFPILQTGENIIQTLIEIFSSYFENIHKIISCAYFIR